MGVPSQWLSVSTGKWLPQKSKPFYYLLWAKPNGIMIETITMRLPKISRTQFSQMTSPSVQVPNFAVAPMIVQRPP